MVDNLKQYILENFKYENGRITRTDRKGLKKNYAFSHKKKTYRYYTLQEAVEARTRIKEAYFLEIGMKGEQNAVGKH